MPSSHFSLSLCCTVRMSLLKKCIPELTQSGAAVQDLHESVTVDSLERMASCTVRALPSQGQPHVFAQTQQPDVAVEVCIKQRTGTSQEGACMPLKLARLCRVVSYRCHPECLQSHSS